MQVHSIHGRARHDHVRAALLENALEAHAHVERGLSLRHADRIDCAARRMPWVDGDGSAGEGTRRDVCTAACEIGESAFALLWEPDGKLLPREGNFFEMFNQHADNVASLSVAIGSQLIIRTSESFLRNLMMSGVALVS